MSNTDTWLCALSAIVNGDRTFTDEAAAGGSQCLGVIEGRV